MSEERTWLNRGPKSVRVKARLHKGTLDLGAGNNTIFGKNCTGLHRSFPKALCVPISVANRIYFPGTFHWVWMSER